MGVVTPWHQRAFGQLEQIILQPEKFIAPDAALRDELRAVLKTLYDDADDLDQYGPLPELVVDGLDPEQIWEEIELRTEPLVDLAQQCVADYQAAAERSRSSADAADAADRDDHLADDGSPNERSEPAIDDDMNDDRDEEDDEEIAMDDCDERDSDDDDDRPASDKHAARELDDGFFDVDDMDGFADQMEMNDDNDDDGERSDDDDDDEEDEEPVDLLHDIEGDAGTQYHDLFDDAKKAPDAAADGDDDDDDEFAGLSEFKKRQLRLAKEIAQLEERHLNGRPWELMGEAKAADRPADALVDADLDFEMADKQPALITADVTRDLEDLIRQRIQDRAYDDVERKAERPAPAFRARPELETDRSEVGLADLYEKEYVEKATGVDGADQRLSDEHREIASMFAALCYKLDALANFHFAPKPVRAEVVVRDGRNVAAIAMEEAIPVAVSAAQVLAPEEVYRPAANQPVAETELSRGEKRARRRARKQKGRKEREQKAADDDLRARHDARFRARRETKLALDEIGASRRIKSAPQKDAVEYSRSGAFFQKIQDAERRRGDAAAAKPSTATATTATSSSSWKL